MAAFATPTELASLVQRDVDTSTATLLLDLASTAIRNELHTDVDAGTTTETLDGTGMPWVFLSQYPVTALSSCTEDGTALVEDQQFIWRKSGAVGRLGGVSGPWIFNMPPFWIAPADWPPGLTPGMWTSRPRSIVISYSHGWATSSRQWQTARLVCLQAAARAYVNPEQVIRSDVGMVKTFHDIKIAGRLELSEYEQHQLDPLRAGDL